MYQYASSCVRKRIKSLSGMIPMISIYQVWSTRRKNSWQPWAPPCLMKKRNKKTYWITQFIVVLQIKHQCTYLNYYIFSPYSSFPIGTVLKTTLSLWDRIFSLKYGVRFSVRYVTGMGWVMLMPLRTITYWWVGLKKCDLYRYVTIEWP